MVIVLKLRSHAVNKRIHLKRVKMLGNSEGLLKGDEHYQFPPKYYFFLKIKYVIRSAIVSC